ncbi:MAG: flavodoxin/nitric oxide synthase [Dermatophilaceae bacterium]
MKALVVYESMFGNTEEVAQAIASGLSEYLDVDLAEVTTAPATFAETLGLIVVGGPTHVFSLSRPSTRQDAIKQGATHGSPQLGLREWLEDLHRAGHSEHVATFDTRVSKVRHLPGSAAKGAARYALKLGYTAVAPAESFYVDDVSGPLLEGELERARAWGERLGGQAAIRAAEGAQS